MTKQAQIPAQSALPFSLKGESFSRAPRVITPSHRGASQMEGLSAHGESSPCPDMGGNVGGWK